MTAASPVELAERVATVARSLHIETTLIGAYAMAAYHYVRGTQDIDLASAVDIPVLRQLEEAIVAMGLSTRLLLPDSDDPLGGKLVIWERDEDGEPVDPVEVVNFLNPFRPQQNPGAEAIKNAVDLAGAPGLRYPKLAHLIALKLYAGDLRDHADVVEMLVNNPNADIEDIRSTCKRYGYDEIDELIARAKQTSERKHRR